MVDEAQEENLMGVSFFSKIKGKSEVIVSSIVLTRVIKVARKSRARARMGHSTWEIIDAGPGGIKVIEE